MTNYNNLSNEQKLKATLHRDVQVVCQETCHLMGTEVTRAVTDILAELAYKKLKIYATDLEAFAKHAKRTTINLDDVKLLVRRNPSLKTIIYRISESSSEAKRKTIASSAKKKKTVTPPTEPRLKSPVLTTKPIQEDEDGDDFEEPMVNDKTIDLTL